MSAYVEDIRNLMETVEEFRSRAVQDRAAALILGMNTRNAAQGISCVGERDFREFLYREGEKIIAEVGDDDFYPANPTPDFDLIASLIAKVYERLEFELGSGPSAASA